jgi:hypothetical protein
MRKVGIIISTPLLVTAPLPLSLPHSLSLSLSLSLHPLLFSSTTSIIHPHVVVVVAWISHLLSTLNK